MFSWLYNLKTASKLAFGFSLCLLLGVGVGVVAITRLSTLNSITDTIVSDSLDGVAAIGRYQTASEHYRSASYRTILADTPAAKSVADADIAHQESDSDKALADYQTTISDPTDKANYQQLQTDWQALKPDIDQLRQLRDSNHYSAAVTYVTNDMKTDFDKVRADAKNMADWNQKRAAVYVADAKTAYTSACETIVGLLILAIILGTVVGVLIVRQMTAGISDVSKCLHTLNAVCITNLRRSVEALENGDLTVQIETASTPLVVKSRDELGQMSATFNEMLDGIKATINSFRTSQTALSGLVIQLQSSAGTVGTSAESLLTTSKQIETSTEEISATMREVALASEQSALGANEVAQGSTTQAAAINEGADLVKQLAESIRSVASDSKTAQEAAEDAKRTAQTGVDSVRDTVAGMHEVQKTISNSAKIIQTLGASSKQIGTIVQTIEDIAEQTNLLALNAAIEAARAGESGRGFAVVADEVRKLAERSRKATEEIGTLIQTVQSQTAEAVTSMEGGVKEVESNTALAERAGDTLTQIQEVVTAVTGRVESIWLATDKMMNASDEVTRAIADVAAVVEQSSASAEEMSASADEVSASVSTVSDTTAQQYQSIESLVRSATNLSEIAVSLADLTSRFQVETPVSRRSDIILKAVEEKEKRSPRKAA